MNECATAEKAGQISRLENWSVRSDPFAAPELGFKLCGHLYDDPRFDEGTHVVLPLITSTSPSDRTVSTESGKIYKLGAPEPDYEAWCKEQGFKDSFPRFKNRAS